MESKAVAIEFKDTFALKVRRLWCRLTTKRQPSRLIAHAEAEMRRAGLYDADSDYAGMIPEAVMKLVRVHASEGHSGFSHGLTLQVFNRVVNFKTLTPITDDPAEWMDVNDGRGPDKPVWQNCRDSALFSNDGGKTYYSVDDKDRALKTSAPATKA